MLTNRSIRLGEEGGGGGEEGGGKKEEGGRKEGGGREKGGRREGERREEGGRKEGKKEAVVEEYCFFSTFRKMFFQSILTDVRKSLLVRGVKTAGFGVSSPLCY